LAIANQVVTIHDCAFYDQPEGFSRKFATWYQFLVPKLARRIRRVITISQFSRDRLLEYCRVPDEKVVVIPQGVDQRFQLLPADVIQQTRDRLNLPERYVLFVGNLAPRKNLPRLLAAWDSISDAFPDTALVLAGAANRVFRDAGLPEPPPSVKSLGYVDDQDLPALYGGALCFAFPSLYEGFGLPVLEAMACGVPVLTSNVTSLPEVAGDAALLIDPYCIESLAAGLQKLLRDDQLRRELSLRGLERAQPFTWQRTAAATWQILAETAAA